MAGSMVQVVESLTSKHDALNSNTCTQKKKERKKEKREKRERRKKEKERKKRKERRKKERQKQSTKSTFLFLKVGMWHQDNRTIKDSLPYFNFS
jgi:hypothetical protein